MEFEFHPGGAFTLAMSGGRESGTAQGTWKRVGQSLSLQTTSTNIPLTSTQGEDRFEIVELTPVRMVLSTPGAKGRDKTFAFSRSLPFRKGPPDNAKLVGSWYSPATRSILVLTADGTVVTNTPLGVCDYVQRGDWLAVRAKNPAGAPVPTTQPTFHRPEQRADKAAFLIEHIDDDSLTLSPPTRPDGEQRGWPVSYRRLK
jgi:hypothetical protein